MKLKNLEKKVRRLEARLQAGPKKLAKLKRKLAAMTAAKAAEGSEEGGRSRGGPPDGQATEAGRNEGETRDREEVRAPPRRLRESSISHQNAAPNSRLR